MRVRIEATYGELGANPRGSIGSSEVISCPQGHAVQAIGGKTVLNSNLCSCVSHIGDTAVCGESPHRLGGKRTHTQRGAARPKMGIPAPLLHRLGGKEERHRGITRCRCGSTASADISLHPGTTRGSTSLVSSTSPRRNERRPGNLRCLSERRLTFSSLLSEELKVVAADVGESMITLEILYRPELNVTQGHEA